MNLITSENSMKSREEYLTDFEAKLLEILKDQYTSINYNLATTYGLSMLMVLFQWGSIADIYFFGAKLNLNNANMLIFLPILLTIIYILINYQLLGIAEVYRQIHINAKELLSINQDAKPITMKEIHLFGAGVTGLILALSRWEAKNFLIVKPSKSQSEIRSFPSKGDSFIKWFHLVVEWIGSIQQWVMDIADWLQAIISWLIIGAIGFLSTASLFLLPNIVVGYYEYMEFFYHKSVTFGVPLISFTALILVSIFTIFYGYVLFATYLFDYIETIRKDLLETVDEIKNIYKIARFIYKI
ncbi:Uncharacterised protein [uncultured archaeon]|nr:Uncharacterised protein [uncultured archaeon]